MAGRKFHFEVGRAALAGAVLVTAIGADRGSRANDCAADCIANLCAGHGAAMVTGRLVFEEGELRVAVETVVRPGSDPTVAAGARIAAGYDPAPQAVADQEALVMVSPSAGGKPYARWFPIGSDGNVRCVDPVGDPAAGSGGTPADVALANDLEPAACRSRLETVGYATVQCPDDEATACAIGRTTIEPSRAKASLAVGASGSLLGLALMLVRRRAPGPSTPAGRGASDGVT